MKIFKRKKKTKKKREREVEVLSKIVDRNKLKDEPAYSIDEIIQTLKEKKSE